MTDDRQDAIVIGGGIVGMACAHYLGREGLAVSILDQRQLGRACSWGNCGLVCPGHVLPLTMPGAVRTAISSVFNPRATFRVRLQRRAALYRWLFEFARRCNVSRAMAAAAELQRILDASTTEYRTLFADGVIDADYRETGTAYVFRTEAGFRLFDETEVATLGQFGVNIRRFTADEMGDLDPGISPGTHGGFLFEDDAYVDPAKLCKSWAMRLSGDGVAIHEQTALTGIEQHHGAITGILTTAGRLQAANYVFALGAWSPALRRMAGINLPIEAGKGYSVIVDSPEPGPTRPLLFPESRVVATPLQSGLRLGSMMEFAGYDRSLPDARLRQLVDAAAPFLGIDAESGFREAWYGWRPMTWDSLPVIGKVPDLANAWVATGHNMLGTTLAPATGRLVADLVTRRAPFIAADAYSPGRF